MTDKNNSPRIAALQELEAAVDEHRRGQAEAGPAPDADMAPPPRRFWRLRAGGWRLPFKLWSPFGRRHPVVRRIAIGLAAVLVVVLAGGGALWWRWRTGRSCSTS
jgi:hypothetical protein